MLQLASLPHTQLVSNVPHSVLLIPSETIFRILFMETDRKHSNSYTISLKLISMHYLKVDNLSIATIKKYCNHKKNILGHFYPQNSQKVWSPPETIFFVCNARCLMRYLVRLFCRICKKPATWQLSNLEGVFECVPCFNLPHTSISIKLSKAAFQSKEMSTK